MPHKVYVIRPLFFENFGIICIYMMANPLLWGFFSILLLLLVLIRFYAKTYFNRRAKLVNKFPRAPLFPIIGNGFIVFGRPNQIQPIVTNYMKRYGSVCSFWWLDEPRILISNAAVCEKILSPSTHIVKGNEYDVLKEHFGEGLLTSSGQIWKRDKKMLNPGFARNQLDGFVKICNRRCKVMIEEVAKSLLDDGNNDGSCVINVSKYMVNVALEIVFESSLGTELNIQIQDGQDSKFAESIDTLLKILQIRQLNPWLVQIPFLYRLSGYEKLEREAVEYWKPFSQKIWKRKKEEIEKENAGSTVTDSTKIKSFIELLLDANNSEKHSLDHLNTLLLAGSETTANSMSNTLFYLALYPEHEKLCHAEIDAVFDSLQKQGEVDLDLSRSLKELRYLEQCWKEAMRLRPIVPGVSRRVLQDIKLENGLIIPKGCDAIIMSHVLHRDPEIFPDPEVFNPNHFSAEASSSRSLYAYIPFGAGPRICVGRQYATLKAKIVLAYFLRNYSVSTEQKEKDVKYVPGIVSSTEPAFRIRVRKRENILSKEQ